MTITISANIPKEVAEYYDSYDLSAITDILLNLYDFTSLPETSTTMKDRVEKRITITNPTYITLHKALGARSKKVSIARLLEFGYNTDVLSKISSCHDKMTAAQTDYIARAINNLKRTKQTEFIKLIIKELEDYHEHC